MYGTSFSSGKRIWHGGLTSSFRTRLSGNGNVVPPVLPHANVNPSTEAGHPTRASATLAEQAAAIARERRGRVRNREDDGTLATRSSKRLRSGGAAAVAAGVANAQSDNDEV